MKKAVLLFSTMMFGTVGLMAQSKKSDSTSKAKTEPKSTPYILTREDSAMMDKARINSKNQMEGDFYVPNSGRFPGGINDVIDVEHEIK
jgi:hypothetical protein